MRRVFNEVVIGGRFWMVRDNFGVSLVFSVLVGVKFLVRGGRYVYFGVFFLFCFRMLVEGFFWVLSCFYRGVLGSDFFFYTGLGWEVFCLVFF